MKAVFILDEQGACVLESQTPPLRVLLWSTCENITNIHEDPD